MSDGVCHVCRINEACYCRACVRSVDRAVSECDADLRAQLDAERKRADANRDGANAEYERLQAVADAAREERDEATATAMQNARDYAHKNDECRRLEDTVARLRAILRVNSYTCDHANATCLNPLDGTGFCPDCGQELP